MGSRPVPRSALFLCDSFLLCVSRLFGAPTLLTRAQPARADAEFLRKAYDTYRGMAAASPYRSIAWTFIGPTNISGRSTDNAVPEENGRRRMYVAHATGGVVE